MAFTYSSNPCVQKQTGPVVPRCREPLKRQATHILTRFLVLAEAWSQIHWNQEQNSLWLPKYGIRPALQPQLKYLSKLHWSRKKEWQAVCVGANFQVNSPVAGKSAVPAQERENVGFGPACKRVGSTSGCQSSQWLQQRSSDTSSQGRCSTALLDGD